MHDLPIAHCNSSANLDHDSTGFFVPEKQQINTSAVIGEKSVPLVIEGLTEFATCIYLVPILYFCHRWPTFREKPAFAVAAKYIGIIGRYLLICIAYSAL